VRNYLVDHSEEMRLPRRSILKAKHALVNEHSNDPRMTQECAPPFVRSREGYIVAQLTDRRFVLNAVDFPSS
jgi:hypothetical protein